MKSTKQPQTYNGVIARQFTRRALIAFFLVLIALGVLLANSYILQVAHYHEYQTKSENNRIKVLPLVPSRGLILDRKGVVLADNSLHWGLYIVPEKIKNLEHTLDEIDRLIGLSDAEREAFYQDRKSAPRFTPILLKRTLSEQQIAIFSVNKYRFAQVDVAPYFKRHYPFAESLAHILGYVGRINDRNWQRLYEQGEQSQYAGMSSIGKLGIEKYYERELHGTLGLQKVEINSRGKIVRTLETKSAHTGNNLYLTLDAHLQQFIFDLLQGKKGAVVVLDARDSSILAMVSTPAYDNNLFVDGILSRDFNALLHNFDTPLVNRAIQGIYPPASTIKPFLAVAGLSEGAITEDYSIFDPGFWSIPHSNRKFRDWKRSGHGHTNLNKAIMESSDTYFYELAYNLGIDTIAKWMGQFGFGQKTGVDLDEENSALLPTRAWKLKRHKIEWIPGDTVSVGIGQGYWSATPLQLAKATAILANNGKINTPHLLQKIVGLDDERSYQDPHAFAHIVGVEKEHWAAAKRGMQQVVSGVTGTARRVFAQSAYSLAGKTGTAQVVAIAEDQEYDAKNLKKELQDHALFIAFAPYEQPKVVVSIILENAGGGSANAAPLAKEILDYILLDPNFFTPVKGSYHKPPSQEVQS